MDNLISTLTHFVQSGNMPWLILLVSFLGGVLASLSPCSLGVLPLVIGYIGGYAKDGNKKIAIQLVSFAFGLSVMLSIIGVACALTGKAFIGFSSPIWILLLASLIMLFGLNILGVVDIPFPTLVKQFPQTKGNSYFVYPALVGLFFALASTPCSSPILASIMAMASLSANILFSVAMLFLFALGQSLIVIICGLFTSMLKNLRAMIKFTEILMKMSGVLFIIMSLYIFYKVFSRFMV
ncbi:MAG: cytochrome c biogenesis CcdA family protein [Candidatus Gastranaerophilales bacterium]|nr:cytochrome c biogenesis CcdA family protein [Candidatus Gastranaerophilales bacterium]